MPRLAEVTAVLRQKPPVDQLLRLGAPRAPVGFPERSSAIASIASDVAARASTSPFPAAPRLRQARQDATAASNWPARYPYNPLQRRNHSNEGWAGSPETATSARRLSKAGSPTAIGPSRQQVFSVLSASKLLAVPTNWSSNYFAVDRVK